MAVKSSRALRCFTFSGVGAEGPARRMKASSASCPTRSTGRAVVKPFGIDTSLPSYIRRRVSVSARFWR